MSKLTRNIVREMVREGSRPLLSLYAPMHRPGSEVRQNKFRWKNAVKDAQGQLAKSGLEADAINKILAPARERVADHAFWQQQSDGLACFLTPSRSSFYKLPFSLEQQSVVGDAFHIRPILSAICKPFQCYVLVADWHQIRLLEFETGELAEPDVAELPADLVAAMSDARYEKTLHAPPPARPRQDSGSLPDHTAVSRNEKMPWQRLASEYFQYLAPLLEKFFGEQETILIFAGVDALQPVIREAFAGLEPQLHDEPISYTPGNPDQTRLEEQVRSIVNSLKEQRQNKLVSAYEQHSATDLASDDALRIHAAAKLGQVESLLLGSKYLQFGQIDDSGCLGGLCDSATERAQIDVANQLAIETLRNDGQVIPVEDSQLPDKVGIAALFRPPAIP